jgi:histidine triad (HIT) family protein
MNHKNCIFCNIINGTSEASSVYEDEAVLAIMDRRQANPGHVLVIPKEHFPDIYSLSEEAGFAIMQCLIRISRAVKKAFQAEGLSIWQSNGAVAGQEIFHIHFHVQPRKIDDGLLKAYSSKPQSPTIERLNDYAQRIKNCL